MHWLITADQELMLFIQSFGNSWLTDKIMLALRNATTWIPLYTYLLFYSIRYMRLAAIPFILLTLADFALADYTSASILKPFIERPRPCYEPSLEGQVIALVGCGGPYGFPSNHAANHFALATFWYWAIRSYVGQNWWWLFIWASLIGYAQVYVGKHFPLDIFGGAALGIFIGTISAKIFEQWQLRNDKRKNKFPLELP